MPSTAIDSIKIKGLFGSLDYELPQKSDQKSFSNLVLLYGENGCGKTTILRLTHALLTPVRNRGYKGFITKIPFQSLTITLNDSSVIEARREDKILLGTYSVTIKRPHFNKPLKFNVDPSPTGYVPLAATEELIKTLADLKITFYFLPDNRLIESSSANFNSSVFEENENSFAKLQKENMVYTISHSGRWDPVPAGNAPTDSSANFALLSSMERLDKWFKERIINSTKIAAVNSDNVYAQILKSLIQSASSKENDTEIDVNATFKKLAILEERSKAFASFGLISTISASPIEDLVKKVPDVRQPLARQVLSTFTEGVEVRLTALQDLFELISMFVESINSFYSRKVVRYSVKDGFEIYTSSGDRLSPTNLSSGEKHLLLLFCNALLARDEASIFFIDEPELSLNVMWQNKLVDTLLHFSKGTNNQFIMATHSLEMLANHPDRKFALTSE